VLRFAKHLAVHVVAAAKLTTPACLDHDADAPSREQYRRRFQNARLAMRGSDMLGRSMRLAR